MTKLYLKFRPTHWNLWQGRYPISYMYNQDREWYVENAKVNIKDLLISDEQYKIEAKWKMFAEVEFDESVITYDDLAFDLDHSYVQYWVHVLNNQEAIDFLKSLTTLKEVETWKFQVSEWWEMMWEVFDPVFITIQ
jgi:hypothetical protein